MSKNSNNKFGEYLATVKSVGDNSISFNLRGQEIKHIRRALSTYDRLFSRLYINVDDTKEVGELTKRIHAKFSKFGKISSRKPASKLIKKMVDKPRKCSFPGCEEKDNLTIDHIRRVNTQEDNSNGKENLQFLCPKHHLLKELKTNRWHKQLEMDKLDLRIEDIEKRGTTDCVGYHVLSKDKFENWDLGEEENGR